jgi:hypothetical protein
MAMEPSRNSRTVDELVYFFGSFFPSQRKLLLEHANSSPQHFLSALQTFLSKWAGSDWLEEYNVERVGEWIAKNCEPTTKAEAEALARQMLKGAPKGIHDRTYQALIDGIGAASRQVKVEPA